MSYLLEQAIALLEEATSYTSCETWSPSLTDEINSFVVNARAALAAHEAEAKAAPSDTLQELARQSSMALWLSYLDKKAEVEDLREELDALKAAATVKDSLTPAPVPEADFGNIKPHTAASAQPPMALLEELEKLTRHDWQRASPWRFYYPSASGNWVDLNELRERLTAASTIPLAGAAMTSEDWKPQSLQEDERTAIRRIDQELEALGLESFTKAHNDRAHMLGVVRNFLALCPGRLPEWMLPAAEEMRQACEQAVNGAKP